MEPAAPASAAPACSASGEGRPSGLDVADGLCEAVLTAEFFERHWERYPLHHRAAELGRGGNRLPEALSVDDVAAIVRSSGSSLKMFCRGEPYDLDNFLIAYLDGASLIVNQADRHNRALFDLSRALAERHFLHVFAVVYLTPPGSQAVRLHNDDQDVFLLQVWGKKRWTIRDAPKLLPYTEEMLGKESPVPDELVGEAIMEFTMEPHDVLYIPRGFLHEAATGEDEPSLHITVTIPTSDYCWGVQLMKHLMTKVHTRDLPQPLRPLCGASLSAAGKAGPAALSDEELDAQLKVVVQTWLSELTADSVLDAFDQRMARTNEGQERTFARIMEQPLRPCVTEACRVRLMHGVKSWCEPDSELAVFTKASDPQTLELPITRSSSALVRSLTTRPQRVTDLPCADAFQRICVLQLLHQQGVVQLFLTGPDERTTP
mmetsp:Transcript_67410/g.186820  ORF Transcript_67410/g.186820 Transcript_67410/m.186820 type:complete len:432 (+) Transcript_67410:50-1345(+)